MSWYVALLPYVECDNLWSRLNKDLSWDAEQNWPVVSTRHLTYLSDKNPNQQLPDGPGLAHYVGVAGVGIDAPIVDAKDPTAGVVGYDRTIRMADILDGTPNTMFIIDTAAMNGPWAAGGPATVRPLLPSLKPYIGPNRQFGGVHRGVAYIGLCDASVRAVSESVSPATFEALATIAGGDVVGNDF